VKLHFGEMTLDLDARQIVGRSGEVRLSPKAFDLLKVLIENRPRAVSKLELQERLWPETFVVEGNVANLVAEVREALGDDARRSRFIRTVQRFGYAFAGAVDEIAPPLTGGAIYWLFWDQRPLALSKGENIVGRDEQAHVRLDAVTVSRRHARIVIGSNGDALIEDLGSTNGTFVGGQRLLAPRGLVAGERIEFGSLSVTFRASLADGPTQPLS
jgi:DNA-binding winged helix-turn-helix (wHTH) protein